MSTKFEFGIEMLKKVRYNTNTMTLEEVRTELIKDFTSTKKLEPDFGFDNQHKDDVLNLFYLLIKKFKLSTNLVDKLFTEKSLMNLAKTNNFINSINKTKHKYHISTKDGDFIVFDAHRLYTNKKIPDYVKDGHCYENACLDCKYLTEFHKTSEAMVNIGWVQSPCEGSTPAIHAVCSFKAPDNSRYIIDYHFNIVMTEEFYKKLFNYHKLNEFDYTQLMKMLDLQKNIKNNPALNLQKHQWPFILMAPTDYTKYVDQVISGKRQDDFEFVNRENYTNYLQKQNSKQANCNEKETLNIQNEQNNIN